MIEKHKKIDKKGYRDRTINDEIGYKITSIDITRTNRILASERLYRLSRKWEIVFFCMNILAILFLMSSILFFSASKVMTLITGLFSLYTIITQYYYNNLNYRERGLKYHYLELDLEQQIIELKTLLRKKLTDSELEREYESIMKNYLYSLKGYENHEEIDNQNRKKLEEGSGSEKGCDKDKNCSKYKKDTLSDSVFYYGNIVIIILFIIFYVVYLILNKGNGC